LPLRLRPYARTLAILLVLLSALLGALIGVGVGWRMAISLANDWLAGNTGLLLTDAERMEREIRQSLARFPGAPSDPGFCSDGELGELRDQVFRTHFIKDVGRIRDGNLACSATMWRLSPQPAIPSPELVTTDGLTVLLGTPVLLANDVRAPVIGNARVNVVLDTAAFSGAASSGLRQMVSVSGNGGVGGANAMRMYGTDLGIAADVLRRAGPADEDGLLLSPRCTRSGTFCVASAVAKSDLLHLQGPLLTLCGLLGAAAGAALTMTLLLWYSRRHTLEARLQRAIARDQLMVEYQPIVDLSDGRTTGAEALVRWRDDDGSMVPPGKFIEIAEHNGSVGAITALVLRRILSDFGPLLRQRPEFSINLNISAKDLNDGSFHQMLDRQLAVAKVAPHSINIELTEHSTAAREAAIGGTRHLRERGHRVYIDDFGTGYSSLSYLTDLSIDGLKIDRQFTRMVATEAVAVAVVPQMIQMAARLQLAVVIEGIETGPEAEYFRQFPESLRAQGWLFGRPMSAAQLRARLDGEAEPSDA
jgi:sensor c-di-GMP phosphodiesterase-like protein